MISVVGAVYPPDMMEIESRLLPCGLHRSAKPPHR